MAELPAPGSPEYDEASERLRRNGAAAAADDGSPEIVRIYVCPKCGGYYGASSMGHLEDLARHKIDGVPSGFRNECQTPGCDGVRVERYARLIPKEESEAVRKRVEAARPKTRPKLAASVARRAKDG